MRIRRSVLKQYDSDGGQWHAELAILLAVRALSTGILRPCIVGSWHAGTRVCSMVWMLAYLCKIRQILTTER